MKWHAFTHIELLVVIAIMASMLLPALGKPGQKARLSSDELVFVGSKGEAVSTGRGACANEDMRDAVLAVGPPIPFH